MNVGAVLKYYRGVYNMTQSEVAEIAGINEKYLGRIERNESIPTIDKIEQLCMAFDIRVADLLVPTTIHLDFVNKKMRPYTGITREEYYCNCCGESFCSDNSSEIMCPNCSCVYSEETDYIEKYIITE